MRLLEIEHCWDARAGATLGRAIQILFRYPRRDLRSGTESELAEDVLDVNFHGPFGDDESFRDLTIAPPGRKHHRHLALTRSQAVRHERPSRYSSAFAKTQRRALHLGHHLLERHR